VASGIFGHVILADEIVIKFKKTKTMKEWLSPKSLKELRGFLGLAGYYRKFTGGFGIISKPLTDLPWKNSFG
jgi:hypothetical protein